MELDLGIFFFFLIFTFWSCCAACGVLVPRPGIEPAPTALEAQNLNHWTAREVPWILGSFDTQDSRDTGHRAWMCPSTLLAGLRITVIQ